MFSRFFAHLLCRSLEVALAFAVLAAVQILDANLH
jgi:hypothetical protein